MLGYQWLWHANDVLHSIRFYALRVWFHLCHSSNKNCSQKNENERKNMHNKAKYEFLRHSLSHFPASLLVCVCVCASLPSILLYFLFLSISNKFSRCFFRVTLFVFIALLHLFTHNLYSNMNKSQKKEAHTHRTGAWLSFVFVRFFSLLVVFRLIEFCVLFIIVSTLTRLCCQL